MTAQAHNVPANAGGHRSADVSTSETSAIDPYHAVFVASPYKGASPGRVDERRQPPERFRPRRPNSPGSPQYGFGWSVTSKHLLRSPQSHKTDQKKAPTLAPGSRREPCQYIRFVGSRRIVSSPKTTFSDERFGKSARIIGIFRRNAGGRRHKLFSWPILRDSIGEATLPVLGTQSSVHSAAYCGPRMTRVGTDALEFRLQPGRLGRRGG